MNHFLANVQRKCGEDRKAKGTRGGKPKETIIYEELNILWKTHGRELLTEYQLLNY